MTHNDTYYTGLVRRMQTGDEKAFRELYEALNMIMYSYIHNFVKDKEVAKDITVESFTKAWKLRANFDSISDLKAFLFVTNRNRSFDYLRYGIHYGHTKEVFNDLETMVAQAQSDTDILAAIVEAELLEQIYREIESLPTQRKKVLSMYYIHDLSTEEIAAKLNISATTVRATKADGLKQLRNQMLSKKMLAVMKILVCSATV